MPTFSWEKDSSVSGEVTRVIDGDTIVIKTPKGELKHIRLSNTDAPEYVQEGGDKAKSALEKHVPVGKKVTVNNTKEDKYGRTVGNVYSDGIDVGDAMIKAGEVGAYGQKASLLDRAMGKKDPASFRHGDGSTPSFSWDKNKPSMKKEGPSFSWEKGGESEKRDNSTWGSIKAFGKSAIEGIPGAAGGVVGAEAALAVGSPLIAASGPWAPVTGLVLAGVGGIGGAIAGSKVGEAAMDQVPEDVRKDIGFGKKQREKDRLQNPTASFAGDLVSSAPFFRPGKVSTMEKALGAVIGGSFEAGSQLASGEDINLGHIAMATGWGGIASKPTKLTQGISKKFGNEATKFSWEKDKETASIDPDRDKNINSKIDKFKAEADADVLERQKNKETFDKQKEEFDNKKKEWELPKSVIIGDKEIPVENTKITDVNTGEQRVQPKSGEPVAATHRRFEDGTSKILLDTEQIYKDFERKAWTTPQYEGVKPLPENAFKSPQEYTQFILEHETQHGNLSYDKWKEQKLSKDKTTEVDTSKAAYEQHTNEVALEAVKKRFEPAKEPVERKTKLDRQKEYWERQRNFVGPKKPFEPKQDKFKGVRQDPPEDNMPRTETRTKDLFAESKYHEQQARELYHTQGPEAAKAYLEETTKYTPQKIKELEDAIGININNNVAISRNAANFRREIEALLPDEKARMELPSKIEKGLPLTKEEQAVVNLHKQKMNEIGQTAYETGLIKGLQENYVSRRAKAAGVSDKDLPNFIEDILNKSFTGPDLKKSSNSGIERVFESLEQTEKALAEKGLELEKDIAKIGQGYMLDMLQAIEGKKLWTKLQETTIGDFKAAMPPTTSPSTIPRQYEFISHGAYRGWAIHPDIKPALNYVLGARDPGVFLKAALTFNSAVKRSNIAASFFHAKSLIEAAALARSYIGTGDISLKKVLEMYHNGGEGDSADKWLKIGMIMSGGVEDVSRSVLADIGKVADQLSGKFGNKHYAERGLSWLEKNTLGKIDHITWDILHDGLKLMVAEHKLQQALKDHPNIPESTHRLEIARFVNNSFGGLNWYDIARQSNGEFMKRITMAAFNPEGRRAMQAVLFAPDWTVSTLRSFTTALPKKLFSPGEWDVRGGVHGLIKPKTQADYARQYQMKFALMYLTMLNGVNMMTSGHPIWDNKDPTRIEFEDGTTMQATKHAMEAVHAIKDPDQFTSNKLGFIPKAMITTLAGVEYAGPTAPKLEDNSIQGRINAIAKTVVPFSVASMMNAPKGEEVKRALTSTLGFPIYGETKAQKAEKRIEKRQKMMNERRKEWKKQGLMDDEE